jgi:hypothetical protein
MLTHLIFFGVDFSRSMTPNEDTLNVLMNQNDEDYIGVPNPIEMFSMATPMTRDNAQIQKPRGANE